jgi:hypothetical protein
MLFSKDKNAKMEEVRKYISVSASAEFDNVAPHIQNAERDYLVPLIGSGLYDSLMAFYTTDDPDLTDAGVQKTGQLLTLVQSAVIHIAYWIGFDVLNALMTDSGFKRTESNTVKSLFKYQEANLKNYLRTSGFNGLDTVLQFLEANQDDFSDFEDSQAFSTIKTAFVPTTSVLNEIYFINNSRLTFLRMKPHLQLLEDTEILPLLGHVTYYTIKAELSSPVPDSKVIKLLPYIRKPLVFLASAMLMEESGADLTDNGLYFTAVSAVHVNDTEHKPSAPERISILSMRNRNLGYAYLDLLRSYLSSNQTDWPYTPLSTGKLFRRSNTDKKTFWA